MADLVDRALREAGVPVPVPVAVSVPVQEDKVQVQATMTDDEAKEVVARCDVKVLLSVDLLGRF